MAKTSSPAKVNQGLLLTFVIVAALAGAYLFGRAAMEIFHGGFSCGIKGEVRTCDGMLTYLVGFYVGMITCLAFAQAAFIKNNQIMYFGILALALLSLVFFASADFVILVFGFSVAGAFAGGIYRRTKLNKK